MFKKFIKSSVLSLVALLTLTSCTIIDNIIGTILANVAMNLPVLVSGINLMPEEDEDPFMLFEKLPTNEAQRQDFKYIQNIIIIPNLLEANIYGLNVKLTIAAEFSGADDIEDNFVKISLTKDQLPPEFEFDFSSIPFDLDFGVDVYIPVGNSDILEGVDGFEDIEDKLTTAKQSDLIEAVTDQVTLPFSIKLSIQSAKTIKTKTLYFQLIKPEFGDMILDEVFKLGVLVNRFQYQFDGDPAIGQIQNEANKIADPFALTYLTDSIIIPTNVRMKDSDVEINVDVALSGHERSFLIGDETISLSEFIDDPDVLDLIEDEVTFKTFTPIGEDYQEVIEENNITKATDFADYIKGVFETKDEEDLGNLYRASQSDPFDFSLELTVEVPGGDTRSETYYFGLQEAMLDEKILDFVIDNQSIVQKIHYTKVDQPISVTEDTFDLEILTETVAFPATINLPDFDTRDIVFNVEFVNSADEDLFYTSHQEIDTAVAGFGKADIVAQTFTPIGDLNPETPEDNLEDFAEEIKGMFETDMEELYRVITSEHSGQIHLKLTASLTKGEETTVSRARDIYINLVPADVDQDILDYLIDDARLLNTVDYKDVEKLNNGESEATDILVSVGKSEGPIVVEHLVDTLVIPSEITLSSFGDKTLKVTHAITPKAGSTLPTIFTSTQSVELKEFDISAKTLTSTGGYMQADPLNRDLQVFANEIVGLSTKDKYEYSQTESSTVEITITIDFENSDGTPSGLTPRTKTFTVEFIPVQISDADIANAIFETTDPYSVVNILRAGEFINNGDNASLVPLAEVDEISLFFDTIVIPTEIQFQDFDGQLLNFEYSITGADKDFFFIDTKLHELDGQMITVTTLTPIASYDAGDTTFAALVGRFTSGNYVDIIAMGAANAAAPALTTITLTVTLTINGGYSDYRSYTIPIVKAVV